MVQRVVLLVLCVSIKCLIITAGKLKGNFDHILHIHRPLSGCIGQGEQWEFQTLRRQRSMHSDYWMALGYYGSLLGNCDLHSVFTTGDSKGYKKTLQEESQSVTRTSSVPEILREAVDSGWLGKNAVDRIENKQTHKVEGYFMSSDTRVSQDESDIGMKALQLHNVFRLIHHSPPLSWSNALGTAAKNMARQLAEQNAQIRDTIPALNISGINFRVYGTRSNLASQVDNTYGENTIKLTNVPYHCDYGVQEATKRWYNQGQHFSFSSPQVDKDTSSFTQVIWKKSKQIGIGCAEKNGLLTHDLYIVALYNPAGNSLPEIRDNVQRPGKTHDVYGDIY